MGHLPSIDSELLQELAKRGDTRNWEAGVTVVKQGDLGECLYIVHEGELRAFVVGDGGRSVELNIMLAGDIFGELVLHGAQRSATVETLTRARLTCVTLANAEKLIQQRPDLALLLFQRLVERVRALTQTVRNLGSMDVYQRLAGLLCAAAVPHEGRQCVRGMSQQRIAERLGASRAMVNRLLQDLARGGFIELDRGCITLLRTLPSRW